MSRRRRRNHTPAFKAKVALAAASFCKKGCGLVLITPRPKTRQELDCCRRQRKAQLLQAGRFMRYVICPYVLSSPLAPGLIFRVSASTPRFKPFEVIEYIGEQPSHRVDWILPSPTWAVDKPVISG